METRKVFLLLKGIFISAATFEGSCSCSCSGSCSRAGFCSCFCCVSCSRSGFRSDPADAQAFAFALAPALAVTPSLALLLLCFKGIWRIEILPLMSSGGFAPSVFFC